MYWARLANGRPFPRLDQFHPSARLHDPKQFIFWNVEDSKDSRIFTALGQGRYVTEGFNTVLNGRTMQSVVPTSMRQFALETANQCASTGCPIYSVIATINADGERVDCERLLLPFGFSGRVGQLLASLQLISMDGQFARGSIIETFKMYSEVVLSGIVKIEHEPATDAALLD
jgi:hypothetical protein